MVCLNINGCLVILLKMLSLIDIGSFIYSCISFIKIESKKIYILGQNSSSPLSLLPQN